jgi:hypothetical protein
MRDSAEVCVAASVLLWDINGGIAFVTLIDRSDFRRVCSKVGGSWTRAAHGLSRDALPFRFPFYDADPTTRDWSRFQPVRVHSSEYSRFYERVTTVIPSGLLTANLPPCGSKAIGGSDGSPKSIAPSCRPE